MNAELFFEAQAILAEGPVWDDRRQCLFFVDIEGRKLHRLEMDKTHTEYAMPSRIGTVGLTTDSRLAVGLEDGLSLFDPDTGTLVHLVNPDAQRPNNRSNDGKPDPAGNFWLDMTPMDDGVGGLHRIRPDGSAECVWDGLKCANGMGWSPDHRTMYFIDTPSHAVFAMDYDEATGETCNRRAVVEFNTPGEGGPDGMTVDAEGKLWVAQWGGRQVSRYDQLTGEKLMRIDVPAQCVSCPTFGGENLDKLFITTAGFSRDKDPHAGDIFCVEPGVRGMNAFRFSIR